MCVFYRAGGTAGVSGGRRARLQLLLDGGGDDRHADTQTQTHTSVLVQEVVFMNKINTFCVSELDIWI